MTHGSYLIGGLMESVEKVFKKFPAASSTRDGADVSSNGGGLGVVAPSLQREAISAQPLQPLARDLAPSVLATVSNQSDPLEFYECGVCGSEFSTEKELMEHGEVCCPMEMEDTSERHSMDAIGQAFR